MNTLTYDENLTGMLELFCPMHAALDASGHIVHAGGTLQKLGQGDGVVGRRFLEVFELKRPGGITSMEAFRKKAGQKLRFQMREEPRTELTGALYPCDGIGPDGGAIVNMSFGISVIDAVQEYSLTSSDFAITDMAVEMLYLVEAKSAAMDASRKLNMRLQGAKIAAEEQAFTDTLTGLKNRRAMDFVLQRLLQTSQDFAFMHLDLDYFKDVNDSFGHAAGDHVLQQVAKVLISETRSCDALIRTGGDEFALIFPGLIKRSHVAEIATRLITCLERPIEYYDQECRISGSIGAALSCDYDIPVPSQMMEDADVALYAAKNAGKGCHKIYDNSLKRRRTGAGLLLKN